MSFSIFQLIVYILLIFPSIGQSKPFQKLFKSNPEAPKSSVKGINGIYVINLDYRPEYCHRLEPIFYFWGVDAVRFSAVCGWDFDVSIIHEYCAKHMSVGQLGCMLSHLSIYHDALQRDLKVVWVMEDDVQICRDPKILINILQELDEIDPEWDVLYTDLDYVKKDKAFVKSLALPIDKKPPFPQHSLEYYIFRENVSENLQMIRSRYGTCSMIVSDRGMRKILEHFTTNEDILWPYDIELHYVPEIKQYGIINPIATNGHFTFNYSDVHGYFINKYYEIDDQHVQEMKVRNGRYQKIVENWFDFHGKKKSTIK